MRAAFRAAKDGQFICGDNPSVGCVLVKNGQIIASGHTGAPGQMHAEASALAKAGDAAHGADAYVTLEPCCTQGRTGACTKALIAAGVRRVIYAADDPNPDVSGRGAVQLRESGIEVISGVLARRAARQCRGFFHRMRTGRPWVQVKLAQSLDGRTAMANGDSVWITGKQARRDVQALRARAGAILTGSGTVIYDDPRLSVRAAELPRRYRSRPHDFENQQPLRVIFDRKLRTPSIAKIFQPPGEVIVFTAEGAPPNQFPNTQIIALSENDDGAALARALEVLGERGVNIALIEAGPTLAGAFFRAGLVNELIVYTAPVLMGKTARPLLDLIIEDMAKRHHIKDAELKRIGNDWRLRAFI